MKLVGQMQDGLAAMPDPCRTAVLSCDYGSLNKELCRVGGAIARLGIMMQQGALALQRLRQGARQTVRVEHVQLTQIAPGGQAVVTVASSGGQVRTAAGEKMGGRGAKTGKGHGPQTLEGLERMPSIKLETRLLQRGGQSRQA
jgi:hypothetical protein